MGASESDRRREPVYRFSILRSYHERIKTLNAASVAGYLFLALLTLFLVGCSGSSGSSGSAEGSSDTEQPVVELLPDGDDASIPASSPDVEGMSEIANGPAAPLADCEPTQPDMLG